MDKINYEMARMHGFNKIRMWFYQVIEIHTVGHKKNQIYTLHLYILNINKIFHAVDHKLDQIF